MKKTLLWASTAIALTLMSTGAAFSQPGRDGWGMMEGGPGPWGGPGMMGPGMMMGPRGMGIGGCMMMAMQEPHTEGRIAFLKAELGITEAQHDAWNNFTAALKTNLQNLKNMRQGVKTMLEAKTPVERLDAHISNMEKRLSALKELRPALAKLLDTLSSEQKQKAEDLLTSVGCMT